MKNININHPDNIYINTHSSQDNQTNNNLSNNNMMSLNFISICQTCRINFNSTKYLPLSFKCGHFFCKNCIIMNYTESNYRVCCPVDGNTEDSINYMKVLKNLILDISTELTDNKDLINKEKSYINNNKNNKIINENKTLGESDESPSKLRKPNEIVIFLKNRPIVNIIQINRYLTILRTQMN